jgi:hypothetical protein
VTRRLVALLVALCCLLACRVASARDLGDLGKHNDYVYGRGVVRLLSGCGAHTCFTFPDDVPLVRLDAISEPRAGDGQHLFGEMHGGPYVVVDVAEAKVLTTTSDRDAALAAWRRLGHDEPRMLRADDEAHLGLRRSFPDAFEESLVVVVWALVFNGVVLVLLPLAVGLGIWAALAFGRRAWTGAPFVGLGATVLVVVAPTASLSLLGALGIVLA